MAGSYPQSWRQNSGNLLKEAYEKGFKHAELAKKSENEGDVVTAGILLQEAVSAFQHALSLEPDSKNRVLLQQEVTTMMAKVQMLMKSQHKQEMEENNKRDSRQSGPVQFAQFYLEQALVAMNEDRKNEARELFLEAAKHYNDCQKQTKNPSSAQAYRERVKTIIETVEKMDRTTAPPKSRRDIKSKPNLVKSQQIANKQDPKPHTSSFMTLEEKQVLGRSSLVNGRQFLPWLDSDHAENLLTSGKFVDPDGALPLSPSQKKVFGGWVRPSQLNNGRVRPRMIQAISHYTINQELVTDCSFVSSLCITASYERRFGKRLITKIIYPQDRNGEPVYNPAGKYMVKLWFNGVARKIIVDDLVPVNKRGKLICSYSTNPGELWVTIIEKAYMKLNGGYDFPGSNSGIDLYSLTGWIPETIQLNDVKNDRKLKDSTWANLEKGSRYGDVLCTVATGALSQQQASTLGLVPTHAYAVLDVRQIGSLRLLQLKNPWAHLRWRGPFSPHDTINWTPQLKEALQYDQFRDVQFDNGIFWIDYDSLLTYFTGLYMNWNFELLPYKLILHRHWDHRIGPAIDTFNVGYNPQFSLEINIPTTLNGKTQKDAVVWVVISRHVLNKQQLLSSDDADFMAVHVYSKRKGRRVYYPSNCLSKGKYSNNPHGLVSFQVPPGKHLYTLVVSLFEKKRSMDFTLTVYTHAKSARIRQLPLNKEYTKREKGEWDQNSAGGSGRNSTFMYNPQWKVSLSKKSRILCRLEAPKDIVVNVRMTKKGERVCSVAEAAEVASSGDYHRGFCYFESKVMPAGEYTIIASTFNPNVFASFLLYVETDEPFQLAPIPQENSTMQRQVLRGKWDELTGTAAGCANYNKYSFNPWIHLRVTNPNTVVQFRVQGEQIESNYPSVNASLFQCELDQNGGVFVAEQANPKDALVTTNGGVYSNPPAGTLSQQAALGVGDYIIVPSTFKPRAGIYTVILYTSVSVQAQIIR